MKNTFFWALSLCILSITACSDDEAPSQGSDNCKISCKVDGTTINVDPANNCTYLGNSLNIGQTGQDAIQLQVNGITAAGMFEIADQNTVVVITLSSGKLIGGISGQIVVNEISNSQASGTFNGTFYDLSDITQMTTFDVTSGTFSASF